LPMGTSRRVTDAQVKELRKWLHQGASLHKAAMKSGMDRKTGRKYRKLGKLPQEARKPHTWGTRPDPLAAVWPRVEELLQREPALQAKTVWEWLQREYAEENWEPVRRTLERRVRQWKGKHGPAQEVFFAQVHEPGRLGASDFTHMDALGVAGWARGISSATDPTGWAGRCRDSMKRCPPFWKICTCAVC
jgi:hypothetical protein